ncbi:acyltransferase [Cytophagaceae bacterium YF14B1]|uniref:Acyltransferase n=1 Tax=Xanthocytophaga flava TaxID=3048013 RepID=A0AAE3U7G5_9BACT|nr:acyltransferase [Xanthocytophaga flavus]MDJ1482401.1 acyltransferase [Xanthocytophaga flavus]
MIRKIINFLRGKNVNQNTFNKDLLEIGSNTLLNNFYLDCRDSSIIKKYLSIGNNSMVSGNFIFEKSTGFIHIGDRTFIGGGNFICIEGITIGSDVMFSWGCTVIDNDAHSLLWSQRINDVTDWKKGIEENKIGFYKDWSHVKKAQIIIKDKAWIGFNSIILKGVTIGEGAIIAAGSVVTKDVPDFAVVAGNPAQIIKYVNETI